MKVIQIVPRLPPATDGVGDYAFHAAAQLRAAHGVESQFIVADSSWQSQAGLGFDVQVVTNRTSTAFREALRAFPLQSSSILLHYVGYGYAKRGCPIWLIQALGRWKGQHPQLRLITVFHELYAFGPPWRSSFWTSPLQRLLTKKLAKISDTCITPMRMYARTLERCSRGENKKVIAMPIFSNMGEPTELKPILQRRNQIVVFGNVRRRTEIYTEYLDQLIQVCRILNFETVVDVGVRIGKKPDLPLHYVEMGVQSGEAISSLLSNSRAGFLTYFDGYLAKSGVFAAYCAHGMLPILPTLNASDSDGLRNGCEYIVAGDILRGSLETGQNVADNAHKWYQGHSVAKTAATLAVILEDSTN